MSDASTVNATEFARHFTRYREEAIANKLIVVTSHERVVGGYLSALGTGALPAPQGPGARGAACRRAA